MARHLITQKDYLQAAQVFHWASREHYLLWFTGRTDRHKRTEVMLPGLVSKGKLRVYRHGGRLVYATLRKSHTFDTSKVEHGLGCTEGLVRFWRAEMECVVISEKDFRGLGVVPEWGILYPKGKLLLFEFCTQDNCRRASLIKNKVQRYVEILPKLSEQFGGEGFVVFVLELPRNSVEHYVKNRLPMGESFMFTDYETFKQVPIGSQLTAPIYLWGEDGESYPLSK